MDGVEIPESPIEPDAFLGYQTLPPLNRLIILGFFGTSDPLSRMLVGPREKQEPKGLAMDLRIPQCYNEALRQVPSSEQVVASALDIFYWTAVPASLYTPVPLDPRLYYRHGDTFSSFNPFLRSLGKHWAPPHCLLSWNFPPRDQPFLTPSCDLTLRMMPTTKSSLVTVTLNEPWYRARLDV